MREKVHIPFCRSEGAIGDRLVDSDRGLSADVPAGNGPADLARLRPGRCLVPGSTCVPDQPDHSARYPGLLPGSGAE